MSERSRSAGTCRLSIGIWILLSGLSILLLNPIGGSIAADLLLLVIACMAVVATAGALVIAARRSREHGSRNDRSWLAHKS